MSVTWKATNIMIISGLSAALVIGFASQDEFYIRFINTLFYIGFIVSLIGGFFTVSETGFFRVAAYPFAKLKFLMFKGGQVEDDDHESFTFESYVEQPLAKYPATKPILYSGLILLALSFLLSFTVLS